MKLDKVKFLDFAEAQELSKSEQKLIWGGYSGTDCCFYVSNGGVYGCTSNAATAEDKAGQASNSAYGTWACNTPESRDLCAGELTRC